METAELIRLLNKELPINFADKKSYDEVKDQLAEYINQLINHDFDKLITYLYRIDVSEPKLKLLLHENQQEDAAHIIAALIIERQEQKIKTREFFSQQANNFDEEEKW